MSAENSRGSEFFATQAFESEALRDAFADGWKTWERDGYSAGIHVPARIADPGDRSLRQLEPGQTTVDGLVSEAAQRRRSGFALIAFDAPIGVPGSYLELARRHWPLPEDATFVDWLPAALQ